VSGGWAVRARANPLSLGVWPFTLRFVLPRSWVGYPSRRPKGCGMQSPSGPKVYPKSQAIPPGLSSSGTPGNRNTLVGINSLAGISRPRALDLTMPEYRSNKTTHQVELPLQHGVQREFIGSFEVFFNKNAL
jgi:hypothetical protein